MASIYRKTWSQYWETDKEVVKLQDTAQYYGIQVDGLEKIKKSDSQDFRHIRRKTLAACYGLYLETSDMQGKNKEYIIYDHVNFHRMTKISETTFNDALNCPRLDTIPESELNQDQRAAWDALIPVREVLDNNIKYKSLGFFKKLYFKFVRYWHAYHSQPLKSTVITAIAIGILLYLHGGLLSFTPFSTILLGATIFLTIPLLSSTLYIKTRTLLFKIATDGIENGDAPEKSDSAKVWSSLFCNTRFQITIGLWLTVIASTATFLVASVNSFAYSMFLTSSASSFLLFPTSLWACFAVAVISAIVFYSINAMYFRNAKDGELTTSPLVSNINKCCDVEFSDKSVYQLLTAAAMNVGNKVQSVAGEGIKLIQDNTHVEAKQLINGVSGNTNQTNQIEDESNTSNNSLVLPASI
ncbi:MAG: hypothetical protein VX335_03965 [Pseudomonadota bacterium]|nr:hypothetical protein [Pseudomonadota bacterium]